MMKITPKFECIDGSFNTETNKMICLVNKKYGEVSLAFKEQGCEFNITFASIKLHDTNFRSDFEKTVDDAKKLGDEICRRWNIRAA